MAAFESGSKITGLGTLFKIGSLAAVTYILMKRYKRKKMENQIRRYSPEKASERDYPSTKGQYGTKIEIESSDKMVPRTSANISETSENTAGKYRKVPVINNTDDIESHDDKGHMILSKEFANPTPASASKYNPSPGDMYTVKSQDELKDAMVTQGVSDALSSPPSGSESGSESRSIEGPDKQGDELREKLAEIDAIGCMAADGNPNAMSLLFKNVHNQDLIVRHEAIRSILLYGGKEDREQLYKDLPAGDWYIMDIRQEDMRKVC